MGGGGSSGGTTSASNQYSSLASWAQPYVTSMLGAGQAEVFNTNPQGQITGVNPYNAFGSYNPTTGGQYGMTPSDLTAAQSSVAGFTPLQNQAFTGASNLQTPGQFGQATNFAGASGLGSLGTAQQAAQTGQNYQSMATNPGTVGAYMNPYVQQSLAPQLQLLGQQTGINTAAEQAAATSQGAFGGSREALANALAQQQGNLAAQQAIGQGYNTAYNTAQQNMLAGQQLGLQGLNTALGGYGQSGQAAGTLGNLGTSQLAAQQGILGMQNTYGTQQQQQQQNIINQAMQNYSTAMNYPMTQLSNLKNLIAGIPVSNVTTTQQQAAPSPTSALAGLGTAGIAGLGLYNASQPSAKTTTAPA